MGFSNHKLGNLENAEIYYLVGLEINPTHIVMYGYLYDIDYVKTRLKITGYHVLKVLPGIHICDHDKVHRLKVVNLPWGKLGADVVLECTGLFLDKSSAEKHIKAGAKKVVISAPAKEVDFTIVQGVNSAGLKKEHNVISNGSCTTNCLAPIAMVIDKNFGIEYGYMTTIHSYTGDQKLLDTLHKDLRRARASGDSMIPTSTGAAKAMSLVLPSLNGKLDGTAIRVPTPNVSLIDFTVVTTKEVSPEDINNAMIEASKTNELKGILGINNKPLVSKDFNHNPHSSIFDVTQTQVIKNKFSRVLSWYDNEWGFSNRMCETAIQIAGLI